MDVPQVALRTALFVSLHDSGSFPSGAGSETCLRQKFWERDVNKMGMRVSTCRTLLLLPEDILAFTMASAIASVVLLACNLC